MPNVRTVEKQYVLEMVRLLCLEYRHRKKMGRNGFLKGQRVCFRKKMSWIYDEEIDNYAKHSFPKYS